MPTVPDAMSPRPAEPACPSPGPPDSATQTTVIMVDSGGTVTAVNPEFEHTAGYSRYEILEKGVEKLRHGHRDAPVFRSIAEAIRACRGGRAACPVRREKGAAEEDSAAVFPLYDTLGRVTGFVAIRRPRAARKAAGAPERPLAMESIARLAGGVAHNYNNLLASIIGFSELLLVRMGPEDARRREVEEILKASQRAAFLTRMLLAYGRGLALLPHVVDMNRLLERAYPELKNLTGPGIRLTMHLEPRLGPVYADPGQLDQVILNLIANARDAMPAGGILTIETANVDLDRPFLRRNVRIRRGSYVMIAVSDTGTGMDEETEARIFEPFFTTKERAMGLGLAAAYGVVKQSGGYIWVSSKPGKGTTFTIYLPRAKETRESIPSSREEARSCPQAETRPCACPLP